ncbi:MAG TPA: hypothetical protein VFU47_03885 [Armatimonadota bacterium]|nr:hypothetical protein [Armatimonadota bacterium]
MSVANTSTRLQAADKPEETPAPELSADRVLRRNTALRVRYSCGHVAITYAGMLTERGRAEVRKAARAKLCGDCQRAARDREQAAKSDGEKRAEAQRFAALWEA